MTSFTHNRGTNPVTIMFKQTLPNNFFVFVNSPYINKENLQADKLAGAERVKPEPQMNLTCLYI